MSVPETDWSHGLVLAYDSEREGYVPEVRRAGASMLLEGDGWRESVIHRMVRLVETIDGEAYNCGVEGCPPCAVLLERGGGRVVGEDDAR